MPQCNTSMNSQQIGQPKLAFRLGAARIHSLLALVLVLLITNGGAG